MAREIEPSRRELAQEDYQYLVSLWVALQRAQLPQEASDLAKLFRSACLVRDLDEHTLRQMLRIVVSVR